MKKLNILKYLFIGLVFAYSLCINIGCRTTNQIINPNDTLIVLYGDGYMKNLYEAVYTQHQFDSICVADTISNDLSTWHIFSGRDGETNEGFNEYMYIKQLENGEIIYRLLKVDGEKYKITKRITVR